MSQKPSQLGSVWNLSNCEREPIHIPGSIQDHGFLVELLRTNLTVRTVSRNIESFLGVAPENCLGRPLRDLLEDEPGCDAMIAGLGAETPEDFELRRVSLARGNYDVRALGQGDSILLEFEKAVGDMGASFYTDTRRAVTALRSSGSLEQMFSAAVREVRQITGFDRVIIYKFDENWNGHVLAEEKNAKADSYLDLHFPASDIPRQARELYALNRLRFIPDVHHVPSPLVSLKSQPLDLSRAALRAVSPIHLEYLRNMEATASMSVSLEKEGRLWGLISCTHLSGPLEISAEARARCELIGELMSSLLGARESDASIHNSRQILAHQQELLEAMARVDDVSEALLGHRRAFLGLTGASGAAVFQDGNFHIAGQAPSNEVLRQIAKWLATKEPGVVHASAALPSELKTLDGSLREATGFMGFSISRAQKTQIMWFRPEEIQTVQWGGDPNKPVDTQQGARVLHPRKSFEAWKETVRGRSQPWKKEELEAAARLRSAIADVVLQKVEKITALNRELERSNTELDSFAYAASHDLKEPLRGIHNYAAILERALAGKMNDEERGRFHTISRLTQRMENLINSLLNYSQVGRAELSLRENELNDIVRAAIDSVRTRVDESHTKIECKFDLPKVVCDRVQAIEVFTNLISNAIKYNDSEAKVVRIFRVEEGDDGQEVIGVSDNGIGIDPEHHRDIFKIFKRLHGKDQYGGGTGTGLTITAKIIERHGGRIWVKSGSGEGTTFLFTFGPGGRDVRS